MGGGTYLYYVSGTVGIIDTVAVILRLAARAECKAKFGVDDVFVALSLLPLYGMMASSLLRASTYTHFPTISMTDCPLHSTYQRRPWETYCNVKAIGNI